MHTGFSSQQEVLDRLENIEDLIFDLQGSVESVLISIKEGQSQSHSNNFDDDE